MTVSVFPIRPLTFFVTYVNIFLSKWAGKKMFKSHYNWINNHIKNCSNFSHLCTLLKNCEELKE